MINSNLQDIKRVFYDDKNIRKGYYNDTLFFEQTEPNWVEIGGVKWATKNLGANTIYDSGLYFQWGDTQGYTADQVGSGTDKKYFGDADYKYGDGHGHKPANMTKYNSADGKTVLDLSDDAVYAAYGGNWRIPTYSDFIKLRDSVNCAYTSNYNESGVAGLICTDISDSSKVLFFPASGICSRGNIQYLNSRGSVWSTTWSGTGWTVATAYTLYFYFDRYIPAYFCTKESHMLRTDGVPIRPVLNE